MVRMKIITPSIHSRRGLGYGIKLILEFRVLLQYLWLGMATVLLDCHSLLSLEIQIFDIPILTPFTEPKIIKIHV